MAADVRRPVKLAVMGAGMIGKRHVEHVLTQPEAELMAIVDPAPAGRSLAEEKGVRWFESFAAMIAEARPEGVMVATPNQLHVVNGMECIAAGVPALVEKPLAAGWWKRRKRQACCCSPAIIGAITR